MYRGEFCQPVCRTVGYFYNTLCFWTWNFYERILIHMKGKLNENVLGPKHIPTGLSLASMQNMIYELVHLNFGLNSRIRFRRLFEDQS